MKPGTFTQIYIQLVFSPLHREALLIDKIRPRVFEYMGGIIRTLQHKSIIINGMNDHVHLLVGLNPNRSVSDTVKEVKRLSSIFINDLNIFKGRFQWQEGYGAFSYGRSQLDDIYNYTNFILKLALNCFEYFKVRLGKKLSSSLSYSLIF